jgi:hypothetical protein
MNISPTDLGNDFITFHFDGKTQILLVTVLKSSATDQEWTRAKTLTKLFFYKFSNLEKRSSIVFNVLKLGVLSPKRFRDCSKMFVEFKPQTKKSILATSIVVKSFFVVRMFNLFFSFYTTVRPMKMVETEKEAFAYLQTQDQV